MDRRQTEDIALLILYRYKSVFDTKDLLSIY